MFPIASSVRSVPTQSRYGPVCPKLLIRGEHDLRVDVAEDIVANAEPIERSRTEALDHDLRALNQAEQELAATLRLQIQRDAALAGIEHEEEAAALRAGLVFEERRQRPGGVAVPRLLYLDDVGSVVREQAGAEWPGRIPREVDDTHIVERHHTDHRRPSFARRQVTVAGSGSHTSSRAGPPAGRASARRTQRRRSSFDTTASNRRPLTAPDRSGVVRRAPTASVLAGLLDPVGLADPAAAGVGSRSCLPARSVDATLAALARGCSE